MCHLKVKPVHSILQICAELQHVIRNIKLLFFLSPGATTPIGDCILQPSSGLWPPRLRGFLITYNDAPHSVGLLWTSYQSVAETSTWQHTTLTTQTSMPWVGFEPTISAGERPKTCALDRAATGTGIKLLLPSDNKYTSIGKTWPELKGLWFEMAAWCFSGGCRRPHWALARVSLLVETNLRWPSHFQLHTIGMGAAN